jgi:GABA permease
MRRYLVVANQTLQAAELRDLIRTRITSGPCSFFVLVPDTKAAQYDSVAAGGILPQPGMWWWATHYARPASDEEATTQARQRLSSMRASLAELGVPGEGELGVADPLEAIEKVCADHQFDEIIVATLPRRVSRWLRADLPRQARRRFGLPVTTIITSY